MDALRLSARGRHGGDAPFHLGRAQIDPTSREATYGGRSERIQDKPLCVLLLLHRRSGQVVTREDIVDECWDGRIVGDDVINRAISILRKLARRAGGFRIDTIPRAGYRLVKDEDNRRAQSRAWRILASALIAVAVLTAAAGLLMRLRGPVIPAAPTVSVLPFVASGGPDAAGMARKAERALVEMLNEAGFTMAPPGQGDLIISGEVAPVAGTTRVQLLAGLTASGTPAMSRTLESPSSHADDLPIQVATSAAELVSTITELWTLDGQMADPAFASKVFAMIEAMEEGNLLGAHQIALRAASDYPNSAAADLMLASTYGATLEVFSVPERRAHVQIARTMLARRRSYAARFGNFGHAWCLLRPRAWLQDCERQLRQSSKSPTRSNSSPQRLAELVADVGRIGEATRLARVAAAADPYSPASSGVLLQLLEIEGRHREAEAVYASAIRKWPDSWTLRWNRIMGRAARGDFTALDRFAATIPRAEFTFDAEVLQKGLAAYRVGDRQGLRLACGRENLRGSTRQVCVAALAAAGETDASFAIALELYPKQAGRNRAEDEALWLERPAYFTLSLLSAPAGAPLRRDARFLQLAAQTGLLRYWRAGPLPDFCAGPRPEPVCRNLRMAASPARSPLSRNQRG